ncbi:MAG TPA: type IV pili twitching motility protein PilT, partial [Methylophilaceae bacterium]|nr:type IV pili twitching motility protein PilT [Methylophilaceae bacterium]
LVPKKGGGRCAAIEILLNSPLVADLILKGETNMIKEAMAKSVELGMQTFDQALFSLCEEGRITEEDALRNADSINELRLKFKLHGKNSNVKDADSRIDHLSLHEDKEEEAPEEVPPGVPAAEAALVQ